MRIVRAADVYVFGDLTLIAPEWRSSDGRWAWTSDFARHRNDETDAELGGAVRAALARSAQIDREVPDRVAERDRVDRERAEAAGLADHRAVIAAARWVNVSEADDGGVHVVPSDGHGGAAPDFRLYADHVVLDAPDEAQLGAAVRAASDRCTTTDLP